MDELGTYCCICVDFMRLIQWATLQVGSTLAKQQITVSDKWCEWCDEQSNRYHVCKRINTFVKEIHTLQLKNRQRSENSDGGIKVTINGPNGVERFVLLCYWHKTRVVLSDESSIAAEQWTRPLAFWICNPIWMPLHSSTQVV